MLPFSEKTKGKAPEKEKKPPNARCESCGDEFRMKEKRLFSRSMPRCGKCGGYLELLTEGLE